jgi:preprotein translocase subunit SecG
MNWMWTAVLTVQLLSALVMVGLILLQHGKGADAGASFGSGSAGSVFGAAGSANFLSRSTAVCATVFFVCTLGLAYLSTVNTTPKAGGGVMEGLSVPAAPASAPASNANQIPGNASPSAAPAAPAQAASQPAQKSNEIPK